MYNFPSGVNFCRENFIFMGTIVVDYEKKKQQKLQSFSAIDVYMSVI